jgi:hypothetical protein
MNLREKLCKPFGGLLNETAIELEKIADNYVVDVIEWCATDEEKDLIHDLILFGELNKNYSAKDLLKIYKKEKGL